MKAVLPRVPGSGSALRWLDLQTPILFVQGTRDQLCPLDLLEKVRPQMTAQNFLHVVEHGDHSLAVRKKDLFGESQNDVDQRIAKAISEFVARFM